MASPCDTCHQRCCHHFVVTVTGYDAWKIVRGLHLEPEQFLVTVAQSAPNDRGFLLDHREQTYDLALAKATASVHEQACIFWQSWAGRCGIYRVRPYVCRTYPAMFMGGDVTRRWDALCPTDAWRDGALQGPGWRENMLGIQVEFDLYRLVVARWNQAVRHAAQAERIAASAYYAYILAVYDRLDAVRSSLGAAEWARLCTWWGECLIQGESPFGWPDAAPGQWTEVLEAIRTVVADHVFTLAATDRACQS